MSGADTENKRQELIRLLCKESEVGLEMESLRVTPEGFLAHTPHPFPGEPALDRDFCENQIEIITPVLYSAEEACTTLGSFRRTVKKRLASLSSGRELLWPFSNPPYCRGEDDVPIARFEGADAEKTTYRNYLSQKYGRKLMLLSGIHYNYSYPRKILEVLEEYLPEEHCEVLCGTERKRDAAGMQKVADRLYLQLAEKAAQISWLIVALTAASPVSDGSFWEEGAVGTPGKEGLASVRCSEYGYWNTFTPVLAYDSVDDYIASTNRYIESGQLQSARELYYPIRLKPRGAYELEKLRDGIGHIEFRMLDLNPLAPCGGVHPLDLEFLHLLIAWMTVTPREKMNAAQQEAAIRNMKAAAHEPLEGIAIEVPKGDGLERRPLVEVAKELLAAMEKEIGSDPVIDFQKEKLNDPEKRYSTIVRGLCGENGKDYIAAGLALAAEE